jgi:hypothetical protein
MWGQKWGQMVWGTAASAVPAVGLWGILLLGCLLGIFAVLYLRNARKVGLAVSLLVLLVPLSALASVPFIFANGAVADATQINANFAAVIPLIGRSIASSTNTGTSSVFTFPAAASFVAPRDLTCVVTFQPYIATDPTNARILWAPALKVGSTQTALGIPLVPSVTFMPFEAGPGDRYYSATWTDVVSVSAGSAVSFGARFQSIDNIFYQWTVTSVYRCTPTP